MYPTISIDFAFMYQFDIPIRIIVIDFSNGNSEKVDTFSFHSSN